MFEFNGNGDVKGKILFQFDVQMLHTFSLFIIINQVFETHHLFYHRIGFSSAIHCLLAGADAICTFESSSDLNCDKPTSLAVAWYLLFVDFCTFDPSSDMMCDETTSSAGSFDFSNFR